MPNVSSDSGQRDDLYQHHFDDVVDIDHSKKQGPRPLDFILEFPRIMFEVSTLSMAWWPLLNEAPKADPHPVMVLPGFGAGDESTLLLRRFLSRLGYQPLPWLQGLNTGNPAKLEGVMRRFFRTQQALGVPISLIGQSLGGVFSREIAREFPHAVRSVITLGSPYAATNSGSTNPMVEKLFERVKFFE